MNEIKFACPHCHQHFACDEGYCGYQIACPACRDRMIVPRLAAFGYGQAENLSLALPVATPIPRQVAESHLGPSSALYPVREEATYWTEQQWERHVEELEGSPDMSLTYLQVAAIFGLALILLGLSLPTGVKVTALIFAALGGGFLITRKRHRTGSAVRLVGGSLLSAVGLLGGAALVGLALIFGACALL